MKDGLKGLLVARRSALEMIAKACTAGGDVNSWFRVRRDTQTIQEAVQVYGLLNTVRDKCLSDPAPALEAAIAVRDVIVMVATAAYRSCEQALQDIVLLPDAQYESMTEFRSQIPTAQSSMFRVAR